MKQNRTIISSLFFAYLLLIPPRAAAETETLVEAVVAVITFDNGTPNRKVIYLSDLERHRLFFESREDTVIPISRQDDSKSRKIEPFAKRRDAVIQEELFLREARRFFINKPEEEVVLVALNQIQKRFKTEDDFEKALQRAALDLAGLKAEITLHLWVERLLRERIRDFIFISPKAVESYQLAHLTDFIGQEIERIEKKITTILRLQKQIEKEQTYIKRLKEKVQIEFILDEQKFLN